MRHCFRAGKLLLVVPWYAPRSQCAILCVRHASGLPGPREGARTLTQAFESQKSGLCIEALTGYRFTQKAKSPLLRSLAFNAEALLWLRAPAASLDHNDAGGQFSSDIEMPGASVLAPSTKDGADRAAVVVSADIAEGQCVVKFEIDDEAEVVVPLAAITTLEHNISISAINRNPREVSYWLARRALQRSLDAWQMVSKFGWAHDAFMDLSGILCDLAAADVRVALASPNGCWRDAGFRHAYTHLKHARWVAGRAWRPDPRALVTIGLHQAELMRIAGDDDSVDAGFGTDIQDVLKLHEQSVSLLDRTFWEFGKEWCPVGGSISPGALHEILWAKALASRSVKMASDASDEVARAALFRVWRALLISAGAVVHTTNTASVSMKLPWEINDAADAARFAGAVEENPASSLLLLEIAVLTLVMGSKLGQTCPARALAAPIAQAAAQRLGEGTVVDDSAQAAALVSFVMNGKSRSICRPAHLSRAELLVDSGSWAVSELEEEEAVDWRLVGYRAAEELWMLGHGSKNTVFLPAAPSLTWCIDGLQLSEAMPSLSGSEVPVESDSQPAQ